MTAPFAASLCGYRSTNGNPSTSDNNDPLSIEWGKALFAQLGVLPGTPEVSRVGSVMESMAGEHLVSVRPDLVTRSSRRALEFAQYSHLAVFQDFKKAYGGPGAELDQELRLLLDSPLEDRMARILRLALDADVRTRKDHELILELVQTMPEESMLRIDLTVAEDAPDPRLLVALSSKWSLRTDRAQDCVSQGAKLVSLRRGRMPHYAVLTMEPRPAMLRLIAYSSGSVDCVYHLALPELRAAAEELEKRRGARSWKLREDLERMVGQGRIRDYDDLVREVSVLPGEVLGP